jgi:hypothetical protein
MLTVLTPGRSFPDALHDRLASFSPKTDLGRIVRSCFDYLPPHLAGELLDSITDCAPGSAWSMFTTVSGAITGLSQPRRLRRWGLASSLMPGRTLSS